MFRPHRGVCSNPECQKSDVLIVVKDGYCQKCHHDRKAAKKRMSGKKEYKYSRRSTGEVDIYEKVLEMLPDEETKCFVCGSRISLITHNNFAHVLSKGKYPEARLDPENIVILCHRIIADDDGFQGCHYSYDMTPHSELKGYGWEKMFELRRRLKEKYNQISNL